MESCILPHTVPLIATYPNYTDLFFALGGYEEVKAWLLSRTIGLFGVWGVEPYKMIVNFYDNANPWYCRPMTACPYINTQVVNEAILMDMGNSVLNFLKHQIDENYYISLRIDLYEVPCYEYYHSAHYRHEVLLYGYDDKKQIVYVAGFIYSKGFETFEITYSTFLDSFLRKEHESWAQVFMFRYDNKNDVVKNLSYRSFSVNYNMSDAYMYRELGYYINETRYPTFTNVYMGLQVYNLYRKYCQYFAASNKKDGPVFRQAIQVIYSHKIILKEVYLHLCREKNFDMRILQNLNGLVQSMLIIRNQLLKYSLTKQMDKAERIIPKLTVLENIEKETIKEIIDKTPLDNRYLRG